MRYRNPTHQRLAAHAQRKAAAALKQAARYPRKDGRGWERAERARYLARF